MTILHVEPVTVERRTGAYVNSVFQTTATSEFVVDMGLQPAPGRVIQQLPWRARSRGVLVGYADEQQTRLRTAGLPGQAPDRIRRADGDRYEVHGVADWTPHAAGIPHRAYTLVRVSEDE